MKLVKFIHRIRFWIALVLWAEIGLRSAFLYALLADGKDLDFLLNPIPISLAMGCLIIHPVSWFLLLPYVVSFFAYVKLFRYRIVLHIGGLYLNVVDFLYWWVALGVCINLNTMSYLGLKNCDEYILTMFVALCGGGIFWSILSLGKVMLRDLQRWFGL